jgi:hypothetical protein
MKDCKCEKSKRKTIAVHAVNMQIVSVHVHVHSLSDPTLKGGQWSTSRSGWGWVGPKFCIILVNVINFRRIDIK